MRGAPMRAKKSVRQYRLAYGLVCNALQLHEQMQRCLRGDNGVASVRFPSRQDAKAPRKT